MWRLSMTYLALAIYRLWTSARCLTGQWRRVCQARCTRSVAWCAQTPWPAWQPSVSTVTGGCATTAAARCTSQAGTSSPMQCLRPGCGRACCCLIVPITSLPSQQASSGDELVPGAPEVLIVLIIMSFVETSSSTNVHL